MEHALFSSTKLNFNVYKYMYVCTFLQLPVQAPPPCLGFTFLQEQHGNILKRMMLAVEQVGKGATSIEERLKDVLKHLESEFCYHCAVSDKKIFSIFSSSY